MGRDPAVRHLLPRKWRQGLFFFPRSLSRLLSNKVFLLRMGGASGAGPFPFVFAPYSRELMIFLLLLFRLVHFLLAPLDNQHLCADSETLIAQLHVHQERRPRLCTCIKISSFIGDLLTWQMISAICEHVLKSH